MQELKVGGECAMLVVGVGGVDDRFEFGVLVSVSGGIGTLRTQYGDWEQPTRNLHSVATSARKAELGNVLIRTDEGPVLLDTPTMLGYFQNEEQFRAEKREAEKRLVQIRAREARRLEGEAAEARNRNKRARRARHARDDKRLAELGFAIDEVEGLVDV